MSRPTGPGAQAMKKPSETLANLAEAVVLAAGVFAMLFAAGLFR